jgi:uncharacterized protein YpuA (DUF1002 family)
LKNEITEAKAALAESLETRKTLVTRSNETAQKQNAKIAELKNLVAEQNEKISSMSEANQKLETEKKTLIEEKVHVLLIFVMSPN